MKYTKINRNTEPNNVQPLYDLLEKLYFSSGRAEMDISDHMRRPETVVPLLDKQIEDESFESLFEGLEYNTRMKIPSDLKSTVYSLHTTIRSDFQAPIEDAFYAAARIVYRSINPDPVPTKFVPRKTDLKDGFKK